MKCLWIWHATTGTFVSLGTILGLNCFIDLWYQVVVRNTVHWVPSKGMSMPCTLQGNWQQIELNLSVLINIGKALYGTIIYSNLIAKLHLTNVKCIHHFSGMEMIPYFIHEMSWNVSNWWVHFFFEEYGPNKIRHKNKHCIRKNTTNVTWSGEWVTCQQYWHLILWHDVVVHLKSYNL